MYTPRDKFEAVRYGQMYGANPNATKRDMRRNGRQFRRYLRTDAADRDRAAYEAYEQQRAADAMAFNEDALTSQLYGSMDRSMQIDPSKALERMNTNFGIVDQRRAELAEQDLTNRIANANRFSDAFRTARQAGLDEFTWKGKRYGTRLASEMPGYTPPTNTKTNTSKDTSKTTNTNTSNDAVTNTNTNVNTGKDTVTNTNDTTTTAQTGGGWREVTPKFDFVGFGKKYGLKTETIGGKKYLRYDPAGIGDFYISESGSVHMAPTTGVVSAALGSYKDTPLGGGQRTNAQALFNMINDYTSGKTARYEQWEADYIATHPKPARNASLAGSSAQTKWNQDFAAAKRAAGFRQGGLISRVNYFQ